MNALKTILDGKKTYICAVAGAVTVLLQLLGVIDADAANTLLALEGFGGLVALRAGVAKGPSL